MAPTSLIFVLAKMPTCLKLKAANRLHEPLTKPGIDKVFVTAKQIWTVRQAEFK